MRGFEAWLEGAYSASFSENLTKSLISKLLDFGGSVEGVKENILVLILAAFGPTGTALFRSVRAVGGNSGKLSMTMASGSSGRVPFEVFVVEVTARCGKLSMMASGSSGM